MAEMFAFLKWNYSFIPHKWNQLYNISFGSLNKPYHIHWFENNVYTKLIFPFSFNTLEYSGLK